MPTIDHANLTDPDLHEIKGAAGATVGQGFDTDGTNISWRSILTPGNDTITHKGFNWDDCRSICNFRLNESDETTTSTVWIDGTEIIYLFIPSRVSTLEYTGGVYRSAGSGNSEIRFKTSSKVGTEISVDTTTETLGTGLLDVTDKSGWTPITLQMRSPDGATSVYVGFSGAYL